MKQDVRSIRSLTKIKNSLEIFIRYFLFLKQELQFLDGYYNSVVMLEVALATA